MNKKVYVNQQGNAVCNEHAGHYLSYVLSKQPGLSEPLYSWSQGLDEEDNIVDVIDTPLDNWMSFDSPEWNVECEYCG